MDLVDGFLDFYRVLWTGITWHAVGLLLGMATMFVVVSLILFCAVFRGLLRTSAPRRNDG